MGGITPSYGLLKKVMANISIPVHVLIRPRSGDFTYSDSEFQIMKENILICKKLGCAGIVSGVLHTNNTIDIERTQELVKLSKPMNFTFHRAFDWVQNPIEEIQKLKTIDVNRVLTSGQETSAEKGIYVLKELKNKTDITIMPGGGINISNVYLFKEAGFEEIHLSASTQIQTIETPKVSMNSAKLFDETKIVISDQTLIRNIVNKLTN